MSNEISKSGGNDLFMAAMNGSADVEKINAIIDSQIRWEKYQAENAFVVAMAEFKKTAPKLQKTKTVSFSGTSYRHAELADVSELINAELSRHGLHSSWKIDQGNGDISVTCIIRHTLGHYESVTMVAPPDDSGKKNRIQQIASTVSYLQRYTLLAICGLAPRDVDDDARGATPKSRISTAESLQLKSMSEHLGAEWVSKFLDWMKVSGFEEILSSDYQKAKCAISGAIEKKNAARVTR